MLRFIPSPVDHILSDLSTMTRLSWVAAWAWLSFIELYNLLSIGLGIQKCPPVELASYWKDLGRLLGGRGGPSWALMEERDGLSLVERAREGLTWRET